MTRGWLESIRSSWLLLRVYVKSGYDVDLLRGYVAYCLLLQIECWIKSNFVFHRRPGEPREGEGLGRGPRAKKSWEPLLWPLDHLQPVLLLLLVWWLWLVYDVMQVWNALTPATTKRGWQRRRPSSNTATAASLTCGSSCYNCCTTKTTVLATSSGQIANEASSSWSTPKPSHISGVFTRTSRTWTMRRWVVRSGDTSLSLLGVPHPSRAAERLLRGVVCLSVQNIVSKMQPHSYDRMIVIDYRLKTICRFQGHREFPFGNSREFPVIRHPKNSRREFPGITEFSVRVSGSF